MTLRLDTETRRQAAELRRAAAQLVKPFKAAAKAERKADQRTREKRVGNRAEGQRQRREIDRGYLAYLRRLPCVACLVEGGNCGSTEAAHLRYSDASQGRINPGMQRKPSDRFATPLGAGHHRGDQHMRKEQAFWIGLGIEPGALAADLYAAYLAGADGLPILHRHARRRAA